MSRSLSKKRPDDLEPWEIAVLKLSPGHYFVVWAALMKISYYKRRKQQNAWNTEIAAGRMPFSIQEAAKS